MIVAPGLPKGVKLIGAADAANMGLAAAGTAAEASAGGALLEGEIIIFAIIIAGAGAVMEARAGVGELVPLSWAAVSA